MIPIPALIGAASSVIGGGLSTIQNFRLANQQRDMAQDLRSRYPRPTRRTMPSVVRGGQILEMLGQSPRLPGYDLIEQDVSRGTANTLRYITEMGATPQGRLAAAVGAGGNQQAQMRQVGIQGAQNQLQNRQNYANFLANTMAEEERQNFAWNQQLPYQQAALASSALEGAAIQNKAQGVRDLGSMFGGAGNSISQAFWMNKFGNGQQGSGQYNRDLLKAIFGTPEQNPTGFMQDTEAEGLVGPYNQFNNPYNYGG